MFNLFIFSFSGAELYSIRSTLIISCCTRMLFFFFPFCLLPQTVFCVFESVQGFLKDVLACTGLGGRSRGEEGAIELLLFERQGM